MDGWMESTTQSRLFGSETIGDTFGPKRDYTTKLNKQKGEYEKKSYM
jgi:hypothetical protein